MIRHGGEKNGLCGMRLVKRLERPRYRFWCRLWESKGTDAATDGNTTGGKDEMGVLYLNMSPHLSSLAWALEPNQMRRDAVTLPRYI